MKNKICFREIRAELTAYLRWYNLVKGGVRIEATTLNILSKMMYFYNTEKYPSFVLFLIFLHLNDLSNWILTKLATIYWHFQDRQKNIQSSTRLDTQEGNNSQIY